MIFIKSYYKYLFLFKTYNKYYNKMNLQFSIIEQIQNELQYGSQSITNIIRSKYPSLNPYIYDITNAYFQYTHKRIIEKDLDNNFYNLIQNFITDNNYHKDCILTREKLDDIINYTIKSGYKKDVIKLNDIIFLIFREYNIIPIYDQNIVYGKPKY